MLFDDDEVMNGFADRIDPLIRSYFEKSYKKIKAFPLKLRAANMMRGFRQLAEEEETGVSQSVSLVPYSGRKIQRRIR